MPPLPRRPIPAHKINILLVGGGGREHSLAWKLRQSPRLGSLYTTHPGNPGLAALCKPMDAPFSMKELYRTEQFCRRADIHLVIVGPEDPLAEGIADKLASPERLIFGPVQEGALIESDKAWAKRLMRSALIPTAEARTFRDAAAAIDYLRTREVAPVVKATGLAKGKGVIVASTIDEAIAAVERIMLRKEFGPAGDEIIIEEKLQGPEVSIFALTDGRDFVILDAAQDHKRLLDGDKGPNTGGMGAFCPTPLLDAKLMARIQRDILIPTIDALRREGVEYRGLLYAGLMLTPAGPKVLEFNARFGDPECQALMLRCQGDLLELLYATAAGCLADAKDVAWDPRASCCIVLAAPGYPDEPRKGIPITGIEAAEALPDTAIFHAGTERRAGGELVTAGGRVLNVVALGSDLTEARTKALAAADTITFDGKQLRRDIGAKAAKG